MSKTLRNLLIVILITIITLVIISHFSDFETAFAYIAQASPFWVFITFVVAATAWILEALTVKIFSRLSGLHAKFLYLLRLTIIGAFFSAITPFYTGGQPAQIAFMARKRLSAGKASAMLMSRFVAYQIVVTVFGVIGLFSAYSFVSKEISNLAFLAIFGFILNSGVLFFIIMFSISARTTEKIVRFFLFLLARFRIIKNPEEKTEKILLEVSRFNKSMKKFFETPKTFLLALTLAFLQMIAVISVPYFAARSLGIAVNYLQLISVQLVLFLVASMIPIPGASGASEGGFMLFFTPLFGAKTAAVMLLWRFFTYYMNILFGGFLTIIETHNHKS